MTTLLLDLSNNCARKSKFLLCSHFYDLALVLWHDLFSKSLHFFMFVNFSVFNSVSLYAGALFKRSSSTLALTWGEQMSKKWRKPTIATMKAPTNTELYYRKSKVLEKICFKVLSDICILRSLNPKIVC